MLSCCVSVYFRYVIIVLSEDFRGYVTRVFAEDVMGLFSMFRNRMFFFR